jgi:hypothetical protein
MNTIGQISMIPLRTGAGRGGDQTADRIHVCSLNYREAGKKRAWVRGAVLHNRDRPPPRQFLSVVDLAQIQHVPLHHAPAGDPRVLDYAPVAVLLAILAATQVRS